MKNKSSILIRYYLSFFIVALIPIITMSFFYYTVSVKNLQSRIDDNWKNSLTQLKQHMDYTYLEFVNKSVDYSGFGFSSLEIKNTLSHTEELLDKGIKVFLYKNGESGLHSSSGFLKYREFLSLYDPNNLLDKTGFFKTINSCLVPSVYGSATASESNGLMFYVLPIPAGIPDRQGVVVFLLPSMYCQSVFENYLGDSDIQLVMLDRFLKPIYYYDRNAGDKYGDQSYTNFLVDTLSKVKGIGKVSEDKKSIIFRTISENVGANVFLLASKSVFYKEINYIGNIFYGIVVVLLVISVTVTVLLSKKIYRPIKNLISVINKDNPSVINDEFVFLQAAYENTMESNNMLISQMNRQLPVLRARFITRIINNPHLTDDDIDYFVHTAKLDFIYPLYFAIAVNVYGSDQTGGYSKIIDTLSRFALDDAVGYGVELLYGNAIAIVINYNPTANDELAQKKQIGESINAMIAEYGAVQMGIGLSYDSISKLNQSYIEAVTVLQLKLSNENIVLYPPFDEATRAGSVNYSSEIDRSLIIQSIRHGNYDAAIGFLDKHLLQLSMNGESYIFAMCACYSLVDSLTQLCRQSDIPYSKKEIDTIGTFKTLEEFRANVKGFIERVCSAITEKALFEKNTLDKKIITHINTCYISNDISVDGVSGEFGVSNSYLRNLVKQITGFTFIDYVTFLRMEEIKRRLRESDDMIKDIVNQTGYMDTANFIRKFKTYENMTPSQYREHFRKNM